VGTRARSATGATIFLLLLAAFASPAAAQCSNTAPTSGTTVTCSGVSTTPVVAVAGSTGVTINVVPGASVSASHSTAVPFPILSVDQNSTITNNGTLSLSGGAGSGTNRGAAMLGNTNGNTLTNAAGAMITTTGAFNDGMAANGSGNTLINNGTITTAGPNAYGMSAAWGQVNTGQLNNVLINTGTVSTSGTNARAASILGGSGTIINSGTLSTTGAGSSNAAYLQGNNDQLINSGTISATGASANAVFSNTVGSTFTATIKNLAGGQIISQTGSAILTLNGNTTIVNAGLVQSNVGTAITMGNGNDSLVLQTGSTIIGTANGGAGNNTVTLQGAGTASNPFVNFQTLVMQGTAWTWSGSGTFTTALLQSGTLTLTGTLGTSPAVSVSSGAALDMAGVSQIFGNVNNAGTIFTHGAGPGTTLTVANYVGAGGNLVFNTFLGADNSPSDRLVINGGTATGTTTLTIHNTTGPGEPTTANGILVVNAINGATTAPGAFALAPGELRAGIFDYRLFQGGISGSDPNNWFLRSTFLVPPATPSAAPPAFPPALEPILSNVLPPDPPPATLPPGLYPIIGPEIATYGVVQPIARQMGLQILGTLHERIGDTLTLANTGGGGAGLGRSDWARFFGQGIDNRYQAFADPRARGWTGGFQGGVDVWRGSILPGHRDAAGAYVAFANGNMAVDGLVTNAAATGYAQGRTGTLGLNAYSAGGYWTHYGPSGWYLDAVVQGTYYNGNAMTQFASLPINGTGFISSLEGGYPIPLPLGPRFVLEPQAQIIWQQVTFQDSNDGLGPVGLGTTSGPTGRLGVRGAWTIISDNGQVWQPYARANLWRDWGAEATTMFGIDQVPLIEQATRLEFAGGVTAKLNQGVSVYAQAGYQFGLDGAFIRNGVQGDVGLRYVW
jgi:outer membrane autotransporter protein